MQKVVVLADRVPGMRGLLSSFVKIVRGSSATTRVSRAQADVLIRKTEQLLCNSEHKKLQAERRSVQKAWVSDILANEASAGNKGEEEEPSQVRISRSKVTDRGIGQGAKGFPVKKVNIYRRKLSDLNWTTTPMDDKLIWVDCEMTGLDMNKEMIMEIGCVITGPNLQEIARLEPIIIHVEEETLSQMGDWCLKHHGDSGLTEACRKSTLTSKQVDDQLLDFVQQHTVAVECPMAGNSIYMDRMFISKQFPKFHSHFHYRNVDVSTIKELVRRWYPDKYEGAPKKRFAHRVLDDIYDSIAELKYYRSAVFIDKKFSGKSRDQISV